MGARLNEGEGAPVQTEWWSTGAYIKNNYDLFEERGNTTLVIVDKEELARQGKQRHQTACLHATEQQQK